MNPLLHKFETPFETTPFDKIENKHFLPALKVAIKEAREDIEKIKSNPEVPTFHNVCEALEQSGKKLNVASVFFNLHSAESNDELQNIAKEFSPLLTEFSNDVDLDGELFDKVKKIYDSRSDLNLNVEEMSLLEKQYKRFVRNGALLSEEKKEELRSIDKELSGLTLKFSDNVLHDTHSFELVIEDVKELEGLSESALNAAKELAASRGYEGKWLITLDVPSFFPVLKFAKNRNLREKIVKASGSKGFHGDEYDNRSTLKKISSLRDKRAKLLGFKNHACFVLEERMAQNPETVTNFLDELIDKAKPHATREMEELKEFAHKVDGLDPEDFQSWDYMFYAEKMKTEKFEFDEETLKPFFELSRVIDGIFLVAQKLYGLHFKERKDIPVYHEDVQVFEVRDLEDRFVSIFYSDLFPRKGKRGGAWMTTYQDHKIVDNVEKYPHVSIVCNFTRPTSSEPSLLTLDEVRTLFHEFGHALHGMLSQCKYESLSGANVYWDFVELPSQVMENWLTEKECLDLFATHYKTGEKISQEMVEKIKKASNFHEGRNTMRQLSFALLDMAWHTIDGDSIEDVQSFEREAQKECRLLPEIDETCMSCSFSHIFAGGYSSGYYSYKWAEVLDADAFEAFKEKGIFNSEVAKSFKENILSKGGSEHPSILYKRFRGKEPTPAALLKRAGLI